MSFFISVFTSSLTSFYKQLQMPTNRLLIKGKVQGVFFRAGAKEMANKIGLTGWVKNTIDGNVEALVTGTALQIDEFIAWSRQGPKRAIVTNVIITPEEEEPFTGFIII